MQKSWYELEVRDVLELFGLDINRGLSSLDCKNLQKKIGPNLLPDPQRAGIAVVFLRQFLSPLIYLLIVAGFIALFLGDQKDAAVIFVVVVLNSIIGAIQEGRAEASLAALKRLTKLKAQVLRDGKITEIQASELVPGDIYQVTSGDGVPTDGRIIEASHLKVSEASLTGESVPVAKTSESLPEKTILADRANMLFAGTYVTSGRAIAVAVATGAKNELGKLALLASRIPKVKTKLETRVHEFGKKVVIASLIVFFLTMLLGLLHGMNISEILLISISQMVSLVPEGLPVAMTIALAVGVQRMAKRRTLVRRLSAVETLGSTTIICSDKTGTLTKNEMTVVRLALRGKLEQLDVSGTGYRPSGNFSRHASKTSMALEQLSEERNFMRLMKAAVCCNDAHVIAPHDQLGAWQIAGDPTEAALLVCALKAGLDVDDLRTQAPRCAELPFDPTLKMMATEHLESGRSVVYIKGAPEVLFSKCKFNGAGFMGLSLDEFKNIAESMAEGALRVLAFGVVENARIIGGHGFKDFEGEIEFLGLMAQIDPPREEVKAAIAAAVKAGIRPIMITGDHKSTALAIARQLGIAVSEKEALSGSEMEHASDAFLQEKLGFVKVFARVQPEQKLRIVRLLQSSGHVVAMTGDGVNDAPALIQADVGVAMGVTGTEVAKEASKIVVTDDNFATIVTAVAEGRLVYQNIKKLILFLFVTSIDELILLLLALIFGFQPPLAAVQILWLNLVSESALTVNLIMEPMEGQEMQRGPTAADDPLIDGSMLRRMPIMIGASVLSTFGWFLVRTKQGVPAEVVQSETFTVLVVCQWFNLLNCRSDWKSVFSKDILGNKWILVGLIIANLLHVLVIYWEPLARFFHTVPISIANFFLIGLVASAVLWAEELRKFLSRRGLTI